MFPNISKNLILVGLRNLLLWEFTWDLQPVVSPPTCPMLFNQTGLDQAAQRTLWRRLPVHGLML